MLIIQDYFAFFINREVKMVKTEKIQQAILRKNGGQFQEIMDRYLYKKYKFSNITCLGTKAGTSFKPNFSRKVLIST